MSGKVRVAGALQSFVGAAFLLDKASHQSVNLFLSGGVREDAYDRQDFYRRLAVSLAALDVGGREEDAKKLAAWLLERSGFRRVEGAHQILEFRPLSELLPDTAPLHIAALFKDEDFFRSCNKASISLLQNDPVWKKVSSINEFRPEAYRPFVTVGCFAGSERKRLQFAEKLTERLQAQPLTVTFETLSCEAFQFDFGKYCAGVDLADIQ